MICSKAIPKYKLWRNSSSNVELIDHFKKYIFTRRLYSDISFYLSNTSTNQANRLGGPMRIQTHFTVPGAGAAAAFVPGRPQWDGDVQVGACTKLMEDTTDESSHWSCRHVWLCKCVYIHYIYVCVYRDISIGMHCLMESFHQSCLRSVSVLFLWSEPRKKT